ncbi:MAG: PAS domain-containing sensor histidine kinase [bacterium]
MLFKKLRHRMLAHIIWVVSVVVLTAFFFVNKLHQQSMREHLQSDAVKIAEMTENVLVELMQHEEPRLLDELLPEFSRLHHIKNIRIVNPQKNVAFSSNSEEKGKIVDRNDFVEFMHTPGLSANFQKVEGDKTTFVKWRKLMNRSLCQRCHDKTQPYNGILWIETSDSLSLNVLKLNHFTLGGIALGVITLLSLATVMLFIRSVDRPIQELRAAMNAIERGELSTRIHITSKDELGQLASGMNAMAAQLQESRRQLLEHHRQELSQSEALAKIGELAAGLAHEIKNPISGIVFAMNSIIRESDPDDHRQEIFKEIVKQANRAEQNVESLLSFARQSRLEKFSTNLNSVVERLLLFIQRQPDMSSIEVKSELDPKLPDVMVDPKQMEQVLINLIINAVHAMPNGGTLTIKTQLDASKKKVTISIKDTGVGIMESSKEKIFQPFFTTKENGVGLGLAMCKEIISRHAGIISFDSKLGKGTIFTIELPLNNEV